MAAEVERGGAMRGSEQSGRNVGWQRCQPKNLARLHKEGRTCKDFSHPPSTPLFLFFSLFSFFFTVLASIRPLLLSSAPVRHRTHPVSPSRKSSFRRFSRMMATALDLHSLEQYCETLYNPSSQTSRIQVESLLNYHFPTFSFSSAPSSAAAAAADDDTLLKGHSPSINTPIESALFCRSLLENTKNPFALMQVLLLSFFLPWVFFRNGGPGGVSRLRGGGRGTEEEGEKAERVGF